MKPNKATQLFCIAQKFCFEVEYDIFDYHDICGTINDLYSEYCDINFEDDEDDYDPSDILFGSSFVEYLNNVTNFNVTELDKFVYGGTVVEWTD